MYRTLIENFLQTTESFDFNQSKRHTKAWLHKSQVVSAILQVHPDVKESFDQNCDSFINKKISFRDFSLELEDVLRTLPPDDDIDLSIFAREIFMGAGNPRNGNQDKTAQDILIAHAILDYGLILLSGEQQQGLYGTSINKQESKQTELKLKEIRETLSKMLGG